MYIWFEILQRSSISCILYGNHSKYLVDSFSSVPFSIKILTTKFLDWTAAYV